MRILIASAALTLVVGCLSHMPADRQPDHLTLAWESDFETAARKAAEQKKPLLVCMIAGDIAERC